jgi:hypothetical protein
MKTKDLFKLVIALIVLIVPITSAYGCQSSSIKPIKPDDNSNQNGAIISNEPIDTRGSLSETQAGEFRSLSMQYRNVIQTLSDACAAYQFSHSVLPEKIEDLIDGFMVFWPGCVYNDKPLMIMDSIPDPQNPEHVGKIFYERLNNIQAKIYYLDVDIEKSQAGQLAWKVIEYNVELFIQDELNPDGSFKFVPPSLSNHPQNSFTAQEKFLFGFRDIFYLKIEQLVIDYLNHFGKIDTSFQDMLKNRKYFVFEKGLAKLNEYVSDGSIEFDMGAVGDGSHYYYDMYLYDIFTKKSGLSKISVRVDNQFQSNYTDETLYHFTSDVDCPELGPNSKSILNSKEPSTYRFSDDLLITGDEVIYH